MSSDSKWEAIREENYLSDNIVQTEDFLVDFSWKEFKRTRRKGHRISYDDFLDIQRETGNNYRRALAEAYYGGNFMQIKAHIYKVEAGRILFKNVVIRCFRDDGSYFDGCEDHVWVEKQWFNKIKPRLGGNVSFFANVYRYITETKDGYRVDYALRDATQICRIGEYDIPITHNILPVMQYMYA